MAWISDTLVQQSSGQALPTCLRLGVPSTRSEGHGQWKHASAFTNIANLANLGINAFRTAWTFEMKLYGGLQIPITDYCRAQGQEQSGSSRIRFVMKLLHATSGRPWKRNVVRDGYHLGKIAFTCTLTMHLCHCSQVLDAILL